MSNSRKEYDQKYEQKRAGQRTRNWTVIFYPEDLPEDWKEQVDNLRIRWIESPLHDKDLNANGEPKKPHHHALLMFDAVKRCDQVREMFAELFGMQDDSVIGMATPQQVNDRGSLVRYMAHLDNPEKAQYDVADIIGHNGADPAELLRYSATETREMIIAMEEYIEHNNIYELVDFSRAIRYTHPEWHTILATKMTYYFNAFIRSNRHRMESSITTLPEGVDPETGEILEDRPE